MLIILNNRPWSEREEHFYSNIIKLCLDIISTASVPPPTQQSNFHWWKCISRLFWLCHQGSECSDVPTIAKLMQLIRLITPLLVYTKL